MGAGEDHLQLQGGEVVAPALSLLGCGLRDPHFYHGDATIRVTTYDVITVVMGREVGRLTRTLRTVVMVRGQCEGG